MKVEVNGKSLQLHPTLISNLDALKELPAHNFDNVNVIDGMEGYGKTDLGVSMCYYLTEGRFTEKDIVFTPEEFKEWFLNPARKPGDAVLWDEFVLAGLSADAMKGMQKTIIKQLTMGRKKRFHVFLVINYIFLLRRYFSIGRARNLFHVSPIGGEATNRGKLRFWGYDGKKKLVLKNWKTWDYDDPRPDFTCQFWQAPRDLIDWHAYERRKDAAMEQIDDSGKKSPMMEKVVTTRNLLVRHVASQGMKQNEIAKIMQVTPGLISKIVNE